MAKRRERARHPHPRRRLLQEERPPLGSSGRQHGGRLRHLLAHHGAREEAARVAELSLSNRAVLITGPAKGMGAGITRAVAAAGADVALLGRDLAPIEALADEVRGLGRTAIVIKADVIDDDEMANALSVAAAAFGERLWGAVAVAGVAGPSGRK